MNLIIKNIAFILTINMLLVSCKKMMHEEQLSLAKIDSKEKLTDATDALYGILRQLCPYASQNADDLSYYRPYYDFYAGEKCITKTQPPYKEPTYVESSWYKYYYIVISANNLILQYKNGERNKTIQEIYGEVHLLRGYTYYLLTQKYGRVPIVDDLDINYTERLASFESIYMFIENEYKQAISLLPNNNMSARIPYVTPNRGTAKALLAELYLSWAGYPIKDKQKYFDAAREAGSVIDSAAYFGYELLPDFADLWRKDHLFNSENIFALYCKNYTGVRTNDESFSVPSSGTEINFFNNYPPSYRKEITFKTNAIFHKRNLDSITQRLISIDTIVMHFDQVDPCARIGYLKFYLDTVIIKADSTKGRRNDSKTVSYINRFYILRYAQTVLTYAEAMARSGQLNDKAYESVNIIRRRSRHLPLNEPSTFDLQKGLSPEAFADSVVWERAWELCAENSVRWNDLRRLELVEKLPEMQYRYEGGPPPRYDKSVYFEPIPSGDIRLDPHLRE
jgi:hypothetical protein